MSALFLRLNELTGHQLSDGNPNIYRDANEPPSATKMSSRADETGEHLERFLQDLKMHLPLLEAETRHIRELKQKTDDKVIYKYIYMYM